MSRATGGRSERSRYVGVSVNAAKGFPDCSALIAQQLQTEPAPFLLRWDATWRLPDEAGRTTRLRGRFDRQSKETAPVEHRVERVPLRRSEERRVGKEC